MEHNKESQIGPALAIVVLIGVVAIAGVFFYKNMIKGITPQGEYTIVNPYDRFDESQVQGNSVQPELSTSTDLDSIEADLDATIEADLSLLDELDEELLDFQDLEDFDFDFTI